MEVIHFSSKLDSVVEEILCQPQSLMPLLFDAGQSDLIVYTHDMDRRLTYMSDSSWNVCRLNFKNWQKKSFVPMFTDHPWNDHYKSIKDADLQPEQVQKLNCEIWDDEGEKVQLEVRRRLVFYKEAPIGVIGISKRINSSEPLLFANHNRPFDVLTEAELSVVRLVVDGTLNKSIAVKLNIAMRTVEMRRSNAMHKLGVRSLSELVKMWCQFPI